MGNVSLLLARLTDASDDHVKQLTGCLDELGGHEALGIKRAVTGIAGFADTIDKTRRTKVSKDLRDEHTALALCAAGYTAPITTVNAIGESSVAATAEELLEDYAGLIMQIGHALPAVVVQEFARTRVGPRRIDRFGRHAADRAGAAIAERPAGNLAFVFARKGRVDRSSVRRRHASAEHKVG